MVIRVRSIARIAALISEEPERLPGTGKPVFARQGESEVGEYV